MLNLNPLFRFRQILTVCEYLFLKYILRISKCFYGNKVLVEAENPNIGGTKTYLIALLNYFNKRNFKIYLLVEKGSVNDLFIKTLCSEKINIIYIKDKESIIECWNLRKSKYFSFIILNLDKAVNRMKICLQFGIKHIVYSNANPGAKLFYYFCPYNIHYIIHSMPWAQLDPGSFKILKYTLTKEKSKIFTVSEYAKNTIIDKWGLNNLENKIEVIYTRHCPLNQKKTTKIKDDKIRILTVGSISSVKNFIFWLKVAESMTFKFRNLQFIWVGQLSDHSIQKPYDYKNSNIVVCDYERNLDKYYSEADIYFQPSLRESQGLAILEAMSYGIPCVVTKNGGCIEMIEEGLTGYLIDPLNINDSFDKLEKLINNNQMRIQFSENVISKFKNKFSMEIWESELDKYFYE